MKPLALNDGQLALLRRAAARVPVLDRDAFLHAIAKRLGPEPSMVAFEAALAMALDGCAPVLEEESA